MRIHALILGLLAGGLAATPTLACNCPKEQMLKQHGTVSMLAPAIQPRPGPLKPTLAKTPAPVALPLLWPVSATPQPDAAWPESADPFEIRLPLGTVDSPAPAE